MSIDHFPVNTDAAVISRELDDMADGETHMIAVEVFDAPTSRFSKLHDGTIGPWVLGPADEVYAWLEAQGLEDFTAQYSVGGVTE